MPFDDPQSGLPSPPGPAGGRPKAPGKERLRPIIVAGGSAGAQRCAATLKAAGSQVRRVRNWTEVMGLLDGEEPALLILDPRLKGMGFLEGVRLVRKMSPSLIPLILGPLPLEEQGEALRLGAAGVLPEDLSATMLAEWIRSYVQRQRLRRENERIRDRMLEGEAYLARILDHLDEGIITTDAAGRVLAANLAARELCRLPAGHLPPQILESVPLSGDGLRTLAAAAARVLETGFYEGRFLLNPEGRASFPVYFQGSVHRQPGGEVETILALRDLTAQEELELRVEESERLAALGRIAAGMAHEIRNPLMAVGGLVRRLERQLSAEEPGQAYLPAIRENVQRMETMVRDIDEYLRYVRVSSDHFRSIPLEEVLKDALKRLNAAANLSAVHLEIETFDHLQIHGDAPSLTEMFFQIFRNAVEAMPQGGSLRVRAFPEDGQAVVRVTDSGRGIPLEHSSTIYHPFFTTKMTGAGMGITKVHMITQRHRGKIDMDSRSQGGTTFTVRLPLAGD